MLRRRTEGRASEADKAEAALGLAAASKEIGRIRESKVETRIRATGKLVERSRIQGQPV